MRLTKAVQTLIFLAVVAVCAYAVIKVAHNWASWVVFAGMVIGAYGVFVAYHHRNYPAATSKRSLRREPGDAYLPSSRQGREPSTRQGPEDS
jgi:hypothetical protein